MKRSWRLTALGLLAAIGLSLAPATMAEAGYKGRRNTAIAAGAVGLYGIIAKKPLVAGLGTGVAVYSYMSARKALKKERRRRAYKRVYYRNGRRYVRYYRR